MRHDLAHRHARSERTLRRHLFAALIVVPRAPCRLDSPSTDTRAPFAELLRRVLADAQHSPTAQAEGIRQHSRRNIECSVPAPALNDRGNEHVAAGDKIDPRERRVL